jgi:DDE superfamily endonuclease
VFIDATAVTTKMTRLRGRARRGRRLRAKAPYARWGTQTFVAALRRDGMTAPWVIPGAMDRAAFDLYVETQLAPTLQPGDIVIADNLSGTRAPALRPRSVPVARVCCSCRNTRPT